MQVNLFLPLAAYLSIFASSQTQAEPAPSFHQCTKTLTYQLFFNNLKIGQMTRILRWQGKQAQINAYSNIEVLATKTRFNQQSNVFWSDEQQSFLSKGFQREVKGLLGGKTEVSFNGNGTSSKVTVDGEVSSFDSDALPLLDADAIGSQMRLGLIEGKTQFEYNLQDTDDVNRYYFQVAGKEQINSNFGSINTIKVKQVRKSDRQFVMWFSPDVDYQLVRATYKRKILDLKAVLLSNKKVCPPISQFSLNTAPSHP
ncbi:DUF3108 domain-containing protein [Photobacterium lutimaris]|uniref:DUF3108 domain-containing protein n=1 Tax=Photobacterium lutimaris TaxID=388278 RepID=A0A2T3J1R8_9GAMM|nr:DUF3108 domain-containing protein [Photobacterium lutimaris]PSU35026.1 DUF3108 domain-containing protein [Photobacterium lutimaris]TDR77383.1 uncharacterized protein DUF3108 [Photobacterium lutimaris]